MNADQTAAVRRLVGVLNNCLDEVRWPGSRDRVELERQVEAVKAEARAAGLEFGPSGGVNAPAEDFPNG